MRVVSHPLICLLATVLIFLFASNDTTNNSIMAYYSLSRDDIFLKKEDALVFDDKPLSTRWPYLEADGVVNFAQSQTLASLSGSSDKEVLEYEVQPGDTLSSVAEMFEIDTDTISWANDLTGPSLTVGENLIILPVSGTMHLVRSGETVGYLAQLYEADMDSIVNFNELSDDAGIISGDLLIVPGGEKPAQPSYYASPLAQGYFICPIPAPCNITQGLHWYNAIDFSNGCGQPVFASAGGTIQRTGYNSIMGNYVRILHPNGISTLYGHLANLTVYPGQRVYQGQIIGYVGNTGRTIGPTGCHVHFDVRGGRNPFAY